MNKLAIKIVSCVSTDQLLQDLLLEFRGNPFILHGLYHFLCGLKSTGQYEMLLEVHEILYKVCRTSVPSSVAYVLGWEQAPAYFCKSFLDYMREFLVDFPVEGCAV